MTIILFGIAVGIYVLYKTIEVWREEDTVIAIVMTATYAIPLIFVAISFYLLHLSGWF